MYVFQRYMAVTCRKNFPGVIKVFIRRRRNYVQV